MHKILLYYKYTEIKDPIAVMNWQRGLCQALDLKGRILIASEGINGTVEGTEANTNKYMEIMNAEKKFRNINYKISDGTGSAFPRLVVKVRSEIVSASLGEKDINPNKLTGKYLTAEQLHEWIKSGKEFYIADMRNDYEHKVGHFENSVLPGLANFRDLPKVLPELKTYKDKTLVTVCTGGVRCEKASGFLVQEGFNDVYQLKDGIVTYMQKYPNEDFLGQLYVFDGRVTMGFNLDDPKRVVVGRCEKCNQPSENYVNCTNNKCHKHFIECKDCIAKNGNQPFCSEECVQTVAAYKVNSH